VYASASEQPSLSRRIIRVARSVVFDQLAPEVISKVKIGLFDVLSCVFEARSLPWGEQAIRMAAALGSGPGEMAFVNATLGHGLVREDMHTAAVSHLGVVIYPALLALSQIHKVTGRDFILGAVSGYEVGAAVGRVLMDRELVLRFRPTGITGPLAGAMAGSRLLNLEEDAAVSALGFAANTTSGLNEWPYSGGDEMFFHPGFAARNAVTAVELARLGARASETALDGRSGLFAGLDRTDRIAAVQPFGGDKPEILSVYYKPAPACNYAQTACQAALNLSPMVDTRQVTAVSVKAPAAAVEYPGCNYTGPFERILQAKMSIQYCVAATLKTGVLEESNYGLLYDPEVLRLVQLTKLEIDPVFTGAYPAAQGAEVIVNLQGGRVLSKRMGDLMPATPSQIRDRFRAAAGNSAGAIEHFIDRMEDADDVSRLAMLTQP
jgi:2-methylcitrate dehydratase PrpD